MPVGQSAGTPSCRDHVETRPGGSSPGVKLPRGPQGVCPGLLRFLEGALGSLLNIVLDVVLLSGMESKLNKTLRRRSQ